MQFSEATQVGSELVRASGQYGPETFLAVVVIAAVMVVVVLWVWKVMIPASLAKMELEKESAKSSRENTAQLSVAVSTCLPIISSTHEKVSKAVVTGENSSAYIQQMTLVLKVGIVAIEKLAKDCNVDISPELARIHGILDDSPIVAK